MEEEEEVMKRDKDKRDIERRRRHMSFHGTPKESTTKCENQDEK